MNQNEIDPLHSKLLLSYLSHYVPGDPHEPRCTFRSTVDIQDALSDMAEISLDEISIIMESRGFSICNCIDGHPRWVLKRK